MNRQAHAGNQLSSQAQNILFLYIHENSRPKYLHLPGTDDDDGGVADGLCSLAIMTLPRRVAALAASRGVLTTPASLDAYVALTTVHKFW